MEGGENYEKTIYFILSLFVTLSLSSYPVQAEEPDTYTYSTGNLVYEFPDKNAYDYFMEHNSENNIVPCNTYNQYTTIYSVPKYNVWIGYHPLTPDWSYASSYTVHAGESYSVNGSYKYDGFVFSINVDCTRSVSITYPADASRASKLGVRADIKLIRTKVDVYDNGTYLNTYYVNSTAVMEKYVAVKYQ